MTQRPPLPGSGIALRHRAAHRLRRQPAGAALPTTRAGMQRLVQELQIHQIELELQNEELRQAKAEVETGLERYTDLYDFAPVGYFTLDEEGRILEANLTAAVLLGLDRASLPGRRFRQLVAPANREEFDRFLQRAFAGPGRQLCRVPLLPASGKSLWTDLQGMAAFAAVRTQRRCRLAVTDISARVQAEAASRRGEELFAALIDQAPVGVYVVDSAFRLLQVNPRARAVFAKVDPLIGRDFAEVIRVVWARKVADAVVLLFRRTLETGEPYSSVEFVERRRDLGKRMAYEWQLQRVILPGGDYGVVCFFSDVTERKRAEQAQRRLELMAVSNAKLKREIARRREVETSLRKSEERARQLLEQARHLQKRLRQVSHQILQVQEDQRKEISRELHDKISQLLIGINVRLAIFTKTAKANPQGIQRTIGPLRQLVQRSVQSVHDFARELRPALLDDLGLVPALRAFIREFSRRKGLQIRFTSFAGPEPLDNDRRTMLYRVAQEALNNVAKHARARNVKVILLKNPDGVSLEISDDGKAFDLARLASAQWSDRLGLIGMRERVEMVGGRFTVESARGRGTTVRAEIPFAVASESAG